MRRALRQALVASALLLAATPAAAQLPPGDGVIRGRVVRDAGSGGAVGVDVVLYTADGDGTGGIASTVTDGDGRFAFAGISSEPTRVYLVGARAGEVPIGERVSFTEGAKELDVELRLAETSSDTSEVVLGTGFLRIDRGCERLRVNEAHALSNPTSSIVYVPEAERPGRRPVLEALLPAEAQDFLTPFGGSGLGFEIEGSRVRFWGPLYPGEQDIEFGYSLPVEPEAGAFERGFPAGADAVEILTDAAGARVRGEALSAAEGREVEGRPYGAMRAQHVEPGGRLVFTLELPAGEAAPVALERSEIWLELDDAALTVDESHLMQVDSAGPLMRSSDEPLLCLPIPAAAEALRFSSDTLKMGVELDSSGALAFRGPLPSGASVVSLRYRLPVQDSEGGIAFTRRFPRALELLSVFVADNRVVPETTRLHRMRNVRRSDRSFLHLEGFQIEPDEEVAIELRRLPAPVPLPRLASIGFALLAGGAALTFLAAPIGRGRESEAGESRIAALVAERETVYATIRDLDEDFETGKLTAEDHTTLRNELRSRAVSLLQEEREASRPKPRAPAAAPAFCTACGEKLPAGARFCPQCGEKVTGAAG